MKKDIKLRDLVRESAAAWELFGHWSVKGPRSWDRIRTVDLMWQGDISYHITSSRRSFGGGGGSSASLPQLGV